MTPPSPSGGAGAALRAAGPGDRAAAAELLGESDLPLAGLDETELVVAEEGGTLLGVAGLEVHGDQGILRSVAVRPEARGRGLGARLTERVLSHARERGLRRVWLLTTTAEDYFPRHGFRPARRVDAPPAVAESVEFREACPASAACMTLELEPA